MLPPLVDLPESTRTRSEGSTVPEAPGARVSFPKRSTVELVAAGSVEIEDSCHPFQLHGTDLVEGHWVSLRGINHFLTHDYFSGPGVLSDPGCRVHGPSEVVTILGNNGPRVQADVGGRKVGTSHALDHLQRRQYPGSRLREVEHDAVA